jgi:GT2 family glycosyltransferase
MPERDGVLWSIIDARDAGIARLHSLEQALQASLVEKEGVIEKLTSDVLEKEAALRKLTADLEHKDGALRKLTVDLEDKESSLHSLREDATEKDAAIRELKTALDEKADIKRFNTTLEEKEAVIRDQVRALQAYRATFIMSGWLIVPLNHLILAVRSVARRTAAALVPRLGVLYQHPPLEMRLPAGHARSLAPADQPAISMVTPSFKQAAFIERTIRSVVEQSYPNLEYFIQDGGSDDGTVDVLKRCEKQLSGWESRPDRGQAQAINRAFARTSGEIMAYLNSDDILLPGALSYVAEFFARHPEVDVVYGNRIVIDEHDKEIGRWILPGHDNKVLSWADFVPQETLFWRRRIWTKAGGRMDESFQFALDWDLLVRFREAGARFARLPRFLGGFRVHAQQKTTTSIANTGFEEMNRIRQRALGRVPTSVEVRKAVAPYLMKHLAADIQWKIASRLGFQS